MFDPACLIALGGRDLVTKAPVDRVVEPQLGTEKGPSPFLVGAFEKNDARKTK